VTLLLKRGPAPGTDEPKTFYLVFFSFDPSRKATAALPFLLVLMSMRNLTSTSFSSFRFS